MSAELLDGTATRTMTIGKALNENGKVVFDRRIEVKD